MNICASAVFIQCMIGKISFKKSLKEPIVAGHKLFIRTMKIQWVGSKSAGACNTFCGIATTWFSSFKGLN